MQSGFRDKSFLLPDFLCGIIPRVLEESGVRIGFYHVGPNLEIDAASVSAQNFDVLYVIDFFSKRAGYEGLVEVEIFSKENWWLRDPDEVLRMCAQRLQPVC